MAVLSAKIDFTEGWNLQEQVVFFLKVHVDELYNQRTAFYEQSLKNVSADVFILYDRFTLEPQTFCASLNLFFLVHLCFLALIDTQGWWIWKQETQVGVSKDMWAEGGDVWRVADPRSTQVQSQWLRAFLQVVVSGEYPATITIKCWQWPVSTSAEYTLCVLLCTTWSNALTLTLTPSGAGAQILLCWLGGTALRCAADQTRNQHSWERRATCAYTHTPTHRQPDIKINKTPQSGPLKKKTKQKKNCQNLEIINYLIIIK